MAELDDVAVAHGVVLAFDAGGPVRCTPRKWQDWFCDDVKDARAAALREIEEHPEKSRGSVRGPPVHLLLRREGAHR